MGGKYFGNLAFVRNVIYMRISPYEQRAFPNFWKNTWKGFKRDFKSVAPYATPPFTIAYLVYCWGEQKNLELSRKNPKDYENDV